MVAYSLLVCQDFDFFSMLESFCPIFFWETMKVGFLVFTKDLCDREVILITENNAFKSSCMNYLLFLNSKNTKCTIQNLFFNLWYIFRWILERNCRKMAISLRCGVCINDFHTIFIDHTLKHEYVMHYLDYVFFAANIIIFASSWYKYVEY